MNETWKDVHGLEDIAMVSNLGNVKSKDRYIINNGTKTLLKGRTKKGVSNGLGYLQYRFTVDGKTHRKYGHVMVMESFSERPSEKHDVNHIDGDKSNNNLSNLEWSTRSENIIHAINNGLLIRDGALFSSPNQT